MNFKAEISGLDRPNKNGRMYSSEAIKQWVENPAVKELNINHGFPVLSEAFDPEEPKTPIGTAYIEELVNNTLNLNVNIVDTILENIDNLYIVPYGYGDDIRAETVDGQDVLVIHDYEPLGFFLADEPAFSTLNDNCRLIPVKEGC